MMKKRLIKKALVLNMVGGNDALEELWKRRLYKKEGLLILARLPNGARITVDLQGTAIRYGLAGTASQIEQIIQSYG